MTGPQHSWQIADGIPDLRAGDVHVWRKELASETSEVDELQRILSAEERDRANRFRFPQDRDAYIVARGTLRLLLGAYESGDPARLMLAYGEHGKPHLPGSEFQFNLSHSGGLALFAFARGRRVGVDIERHRPDVAGLEIARRFFSPQEVAALNIVPPEQLTAAFFNCWTRKEAFIKAVGSGLTMRLDSFDVALAPGEPARLLAVRGDRGEPAHWLLEAVPTEEGWSAAVAVEAPLERLLFFQAGSADQVRIP